MFKKLLATATAAALTMGGSVQADTRVTTRLDAGHQQLWDTLVEYGVEAHVNPGPVCNDPDSPYMGVYFYAESAGIPVLGICQDNRFAYNEAEVPWTANDLDTLRHEAIHYIQDCVDGEVSMTLDPLHDGNGPGPGTFTYGGVVEALGVERAEMIANGYADKGARVIRLEHEAFLSAAVLPPEDIVTLIKYTCSAK